MQTGVYFVLVMTAIVSEENVDFTTEELKMLIQEIDSNVTLHYIEINSNMTLSAVNETGNFHPSRNCHMSKIYYIRIIYNHDR